MDSIQAMELPDHEQLSRIARDDPDAFEELRRKLIDSYIESVPEPMKPRLRGIQFQVNCLRQTSRSALGLTVKISALMWESFLQLNSQWQGLVQYKQVCFSSAFIGDGGTNAPIRKARVLEFRPRRLALTHDVSRSP